MEADYEWWVRALRTSPNSQERVRVAAALGNSGESAARDVLVHALFQDPSGQVREACALALGALSDPTAVEPLNQVLGGDTDRDARIGAARALEQLADRRAEPALINAALGDPDYLVRGEAAHALGDCGGVEALSVLRQCLDDCELRKDDLQRPVFALLGLAHRLLAEKVGARGRPEERVQATEAETDSTP